ncbi:MAG TPA: response regulator transcription factor [Verrucomicrobiae bacterium]|nr:response regulator transcription factor [Verrucomicrobiae bacterium]
MAGHRKRIYVVDDHPIVCEHLAMLLNREPDLVVCGHSGAATEACEQIARLQPDLVIADLSLGAQGGLQLIETLHAAHPRLLILVLSAYDETVYAERALRLGANGYISKNIAGHGIKAAIRKVLGGRTAVSEAVAERLLRHITGHRADTTSHPLELLSDRELEVLRHVGNGCRPKEIAARMHLSIKTLEGYEARIKTKLHLTTATELSRAAYDWVKAGLL